MDKRLKGANEIKQTEDTEEAKKHRSIIKVVKFTGCVLCGILLVALTEITSGIFASSSDFIRMIFRQIGYALITYAIIDAVFAAAHDREIKELINNLKEKLGLNIETLKDTVGITQGAIKTGLSSVKATRGDAIKEIQGKMEEVINRCNEDNIYNEDSQSHKDEEKKYTIKILGISLGDYLCPHGPLYHEFKKLISMSNVRVKLLILRDGSFSAIQRAKIEENGVFRNNSEIIESMKNGSYSADEEADTEEELITECEKYKMISLDPSRGCEFGKVKSSININAVDCYSYLQTKCHNELRTATLYLYNLCNNKETIEEEYRDVLKKKMRDKGIKQPEKIKEHVDKVVKEKLDGVIKEWQDKWQYIKSYDYAPLLLMIEFEDTMFVENYHLASRGGESPILQIKAETNLFRIYDEHFCMLFNELDLSGPIDSFSCLNEPCGLGVVIAQKIEKAKRSQKKYDGQEEQNNDE